MLQLCGCPWCLTSCTNDAAANPQSESSLNPMIFFFELENATCSLVLSFHALPSYSQKYSVTAGVFRTVSPGRAATTDLSWVQRMPVTHSSFQAGLAPGNESIGIPVSPICGNTVPSGTG